MKRFLSCFLLCLAMFALPVQGAAAAVMMVCSTVQAAGLSMTERHAAIKASAESALGSASHKHCGDDAVQVMTDPDGKAQPLQLHDTHEGHDDKSQHDGHHAAGGACNACAACAAAAGLLPELPLVALAHSAHAAPLATATPFASFLPVPADRPPAARC